MNEQRLPDMASSSWWEAANERWDAPLARFLAWLVATAGILGIALAVWMAYDDLRVRNEMFDGLGTHIALLLGAASLLPIVTGFLYLHRPTRLTFGIVAAVAVGGTVLLALGLL